MAPKSPKSPAPAVRQGSTAGVVQNVQQVDDGGKMAKYWAFRFTGSKVELDKILEAMDVNWIEEYGFQKERGKKRGVEHYQGSFVVEPRKRFKCLEKHFKGVSEELVFDGRDYLQPTKSDAANAYGMKEDTRIDGPWWKGPRYEELAKELVFTIDITLRPWQKKITNILDGPICHRTIWWFYEPYGGAGKTTFLKWIDLNYNDVCISGGKSADMKNGIIRHIERTGRTPKIVLMNIPKNFDYQYFSSNGIEEIKDMFFYSGKYGGKDENGQVNKARPHMIIMANQPPPNYQEWANDRLKLVRLPDGAAKDVKPVEEEVWAE